MCFILYVMSYDLRVDFQILEMIVIPEFTKNLKLVVGKDALHGECLGLKNLAGRLKGFCMQVQKTVPVTVLRHWKMVDVNIFTAFDAVPTIIKPLKQSSSKIQIHHRRYCFFAKICSDVEHNKPRFAGKY